MRKKIILGLTLALLFIGCIFIFSCSGGEFSEYQWETTTINGPFGTNPNNKMCCATVTCTSNSHRNCQRHVDNIPQCADGGVCVVIDRMDTLAQYYNGDSLSAFYDKYDLNILIPDLAIYKPDAMDSLKAGVYQLHVSAADSSIIILKAPFDSITSANVVWACEGINRRNVYVAGTRQ